MFIFYFTRLIITVLSLYRDSSCACFSINGQPRFGRILNFFVVGVNANNKVMEHLFALVELYKSLNPFGLRYFNSNIILSRTRLGRKEKKMIYLRNITYKCLFLSCDRFDELCRRNVYICSTLLNHVVDLINNV